MDRKLGNNVIVGALVVAGICAFVFILFNIGGGGGLFSRNYSLYSRFKHVKGLHFGSEVSLAGLRIGTVKDISIAKDNPKELLVELHIDATHRDRIRGDSVATIRTQGVLGDKYIEVALGSPDFPVLPPGSTLATREDEDFFAKGGSLVSEVKRQFEKGGDVDKVLANLAVLSQNLVVLTTDIRRERGLLHEMVYGKSGAELSAAARELHLILAKIQQGEGTIGGLVNDPTVYEDLKSLLGGAKRSSILRYFLRSFSEDGQPKAQADKAAQVPKR